MSCYTITLPEICVRRRDTIKLRLNNLRWRDPRWQTSRPSELIDFPSYFSRGFWGVKANPDTPTHLFLLDTEGDSMSWGRGYIDVDIAKNVILNAGRIFASDIEVLYAGGQQVFSLYEADWRVERDITTATYLDEAGVANREFGRKIIDCSGFVLIFPFDSSAQDIEAPTVNITPGNGSVDIDRSGIVRFSFNESVRRLDDSDITNASLGSIVRYEDSAGNPVPFNGTINNAKNEITLVPVTFLDANKLYTAIINPLVEDFSGNVISGTSSTFRTEQEISALPPTNISGEATGPNVGRISWTSGSNADSTTLEYSLSSSFSPSTTLNNQTSPVTLNSLPSSQQVYFRLRSVKGASVSAWVTGVFTTQSTILTAPTNISATPGNGNFTVNFSNVPGRTDHIIRRTTEAGNYSNAATKVGTNSPITTISIPVNTYFYQVAARVNGVVQTWSDERSVIVSQPAILAAPSTTSATPTSDGATITFASVTGNTDYIAQYTSTSGSYSNPGTKTGSTSPITITGLNPGQTYFYRVAARKSGVNQTFSAEKSFTVQGQVVTLQTIKGSYGWPVPNTQAELNAMTVSQDTGVGQGSNIALTIDRTVPGQTDIIQIDASKTITAMTAAGLPALSNFTSKVIGNTKIYYLNGASQGPTSNTNYIITVS